MIRLAQQYASVFPNHCVRCCCAIFLVLALHVQLSLDSIAAATDEPAPVTLDAILQIQSGDGSLHGGCLSSMDRGYAVGDRGLILATMNGGKTWGTQKSGVSASLYAVHFDDLKQGCIVGGTIRPHSLRSEGTVLITSDGGIHWKEVPASHLPRLKGLQSLGEAHLIAWGDYSSVFNSSVFESIDGGLTWNPVPVACGQIQACAWLSSNEGIIVDSLNRVMKFDGKLKPVSLGGDPTQPILRCRCLESGLWMVGANAQLYRSIDGKNWSKILLPGSPRDHRFIQLHDIYGYEDQIWVVGNPGSVVWHSQDGGAHWVVQKTKQTLPLDSICGFQGDRLMALGAMANILGSRNSGNGWWTEHRNAERVALLNVSSTPAKGAWDALALSSWQHGRQSAFLAIHDDQLESRVDMLPSVDARLDVLRNRIGLASVRMESHYPIRGNLIQRGEHWDGYAPQSDLHGHSLIEWTMVEEIRHLRPDVVIADAVQKSSDLEKRSSEAVVQAIQMAADGNLQLFSAASGIAESPWKVSKLFVPSAAAPLSIGQDHVLSNPGMLLGEVVLPTTAMHITESPPKNSQYLLVHSTNTAETFQREFFGGLPPTNASKRDVPNKNFFSYADLTRETARKRELNELAKASGPKWERDIRWELKLKQSLSGRPNEFCDQQLLQLAEACREAGYWNRWQSSLGQIIRRNPNSGAAEEAYRTVMAFENSREIQLWLEGMRSSQPTELNEHAAVAVATETPTSPFERAANGPGNVAQASFNQPLENGTERKTQRGAGSNVLQKLIDEPDLVDVARVENGNGAEIKNLLEPNAYHWLNKQMSEQDASFVMQPNIQLLMLSPSMRDDTKPDSKADPNAIFTSLSQKVGIAGWCQVGEQESAWIKSRMHTESMKASRTRIRPHLDGSLEEACWRKTPVTLASDPWNSEEIPPAEIRFLYDDEYLFVGVKCYLHRSQSEDAGRRAKRSWDMLREDRDHFVLRFDIDRDYATWFSFGVDDQGRTLDRCCEMSAWNPTWLVAQAPIEQGWVTELAIPLKEICGSRVAASDCWAANFHRSLPGGPTQNNGRVASDRFLPQGMRLLHFLPGD